LVAVRRAHFTGVVGADAGRNPVRSTGCPARGEDVGTEVQTGKG
jgi:hypothetical protein